jgi:hypothetical protein
MHAEMAVYDSANDSPNAEGRPATEVTGTPLQLQPVSSPASDAKEESSVIGATAPTPFAEHVPTVGSLVAEADIAIDLLVDAGNDLAISTQREMQLADGRALRKTAAIQRLMELENPETKKPHTATSAERVVEADVEYMNYRQVEHAAVVRRIQAEAQLSAAKLRARLAIVMAEASLQ